MAVEFGVPLVQMCMPIVRRARQDDCRSIMRTHTGAVRTIPAYHYTPEEIEAWAIPRKLESYQQAVDHKEFYVAAEGEDIVGFGVLDQNEGVVEAVYVSPEVKGKGLGLMLLRKLEARARELGLDMLRLNASLNAVGFYKRAGYVAQAESKYRLASGVEIRCVPMAKELKPGADAI